MPSAASPPASPPWLGLAGPTASGKSALAAQLARHLPIEIVSVDSAQVYRGMDIGTAKPSAAERAAITHHLIDIRDPAQAYSAAAFVADARAAIAAIHARGRVPLLVGGTMLYFHALMHGLDEMPAADPAVRARLDAEAAASGWPALHARLAEVDPDTAARLAPNDSQRIQRALEVFESSGQPMSWWQRRSPNATAARAAAGSLVSLEPASRQWLHDRIVARFDAMLAAGFVDEVRVLRSRGDLEASMPSMRCVGYRQIWQALDAEGGAFDHRRRHAMREAGIAATRQLAKRQITWLRSMRGRRVIACDDAPRRVFDEVLRAVRDIATAAAAARAEPGSGQPGITG
jgi:tRNA dimethylallyltransferase